MKRLLLALALAWSLSAFAQAPYQRNAFTTNAEPFFLSTFGLSPVMLRMNAGTNVDGLAHWSQALLATGTNAAFGGNLSGYTGTFSNSVVLPFGTASTLLSLSAGKNVTSLANGVGILTNDGSGGFGFTTNISQAITVNNFSTTNLTVFNTITVSNIIATNITVISSLTTSNFYAVNGNHNTLIVTNALTLNSLKTNLLAVTSTGLITNANYGTGLTWTPSTLTLSASSGTTVSVNATNVTTPNLQDTATVTWGVSGSNVTATAVSSGGASTWVPVATLAFSTTNVTLPLNGGTNFYVVLTNGNPGYFNSSGAPAAATTNTTWTLTVAQDATGVRTMNWDTTVFKFPAAVVPVCTTNASAIDVFILTSSPVTAGKVFVTWQPDFR